MMSSNITAQLSKIFENYVFNKVDLSTSVSEVEMKKIKKLTMLNVNLCNGISKKVLKLKKKNY